MKQILTLFLIVLTFSCLNAQQNIEFQSAEERIVYNVQNNLNKYEGVVIEYIYQVLDSVMPNESELQYLANKYFTGALGSEIYTADGISYISFLTEGKRSNHQGSFLLRDELFKRFSFSDRKYHLK